MGLLNGLKSLFGPGKVEIRERFEIEREGASGTMSRFFKARDRQTGKVVGLKILDREKTSLFESRFKGLNKPSEAEIVTALDHPRIVKLIEHGVTTNDEPFLVMEFLEGPGLHSLLIGKSKLLDGRRVSLLRQMAEALKAVHEAGFLHRDICPPNYVATPDAQSLKLIDFGLALPATPQFMQPGNRTGKPNYMAPEIVKRQTTDVRVDVFAFGVTAYELCTFELPWERGDNGQAALGHDQPPVDIRKRRPTLHPALAQAISQCIEPNRDRRLRSLDQFIKAIALVKHEDGK
jgi:serine/threonine protein kinase